MPRGDKSSSTRESLLRAGARVFVNRGLHGATIREVVEEAGLTIPVLYYHFTGKEDLYQQVIEEGRARFQAMISEALASETDTERKLLAIAQVYVRFGQEDPLRLRLLCSELFRARDAGEPDSDMGQLNAWTQEQIEKVLRRGVRRGDVAVQNIRLARRLFVAILVGLLVEQARNPETALLGESLSEQAVRLYLQGISKVET